MKEDLIYFELNNWTPGKHYPDKQPFTKWVGNESDDDDWEKDTFCDDEYLKKNELVVSFCVIDQSFNFCVIAKKSWVEHNCPSLLNEDSKFLSKFDDDDFMGRFGTPFLDYTEENFGFHYFHEVEDPSGFWYWKEETKTGDEE